MADINDDTVLDALDERAKELNMQATEFLGPDYIPDAETTVANGRLHAEIVYLDGLKPKTDKEVVAANMEMLEEAVEDVSDTLEEGLDKLSSTILQRQEDQAVEHANLVKNLPVAFLGVPNYVEKDKERDLSKAYSTFSAGQSDLVTLQSEQKGELINIRDWLEKSYVQTQVSSYADEAEEQDKQRAEVMQSRQLEELEELNDNIKDLTRSVDSNGGGIFDSAGDMFGGMGGKDKNGRHDKHDKKDKKGERGGLNRRDGKHKTSPRERLSGFGGKAGAALKVAAGATLAYAYFGDFLFGEDENDSGFVGALYDTTKETIFGKADEAEDQIKTETEATKVHTETVEETIKEETKTLQERKEEYVKVLTQAANAPIIPETSFTSAPIAEGAGAVAATALVAGGVYKGRKYLGEAANGITLNKSQGAIANATHVPATDVKVSQIDDALPEAMPKAKGVGRFLPKGAGALTLATGAYDAYSIYTDDSLTDDEKTVAYAGAGGSMAGGVAGAAAGAALGTLLLPAAGTLIGGLLGGIGGSILGEEAVASAVEWIIGKEEDIPKQIDAEVAAEMEDTKSYYDPTNHRESQNWQSGSTTYGNKIPPSALSTTVTNNQTNITKSEDSLETETAMFDEANKKTDDNTKAMEDLTKVMKSTGLGLGGLTALAGSTKGVQSWSKMFAQPKDTEAPKDLGGAGVLMAGVDPEEVARQVTTSSLVTEGDSFVNDVTAKANEQLANNRRVTSHAMYVNAYNEHSNVDDVTNSISDSASYSSPMSQASLREAVNALGTYAANVGGYKTWLNDFGQTSVTFQDFIAYKNGSLQVSVPEEASVPTVVPHPSVAIPETNDVLADVPLPKPTPKPVSKPTSKPTSKPVSKPASKPVEQKPVVPQVDPLDLRDKASALRDEAEAISDPSEKKAKLLEADSLDEQATKVESELKANSPVTNEVPDDVSTIEPTSDVNVDQQKTETTKVLSEDQDKYERFSAKVLDYQARAEKTDNPKAKKAYLDAAEAMERAAAQAKERLDAKQSAQPEVTPTADTGIVTADTSGEEGYGSYADERFDENYDFGTDSEKNEAKHENKFDSTIAEWKRQGITYEQVMEKFDRMGFANSGSSSLKNDIARAYGIEPVQYANPDIQIAEVESDPAPIAANVQVPEMLRRLPTTDSTEVAIENDPTKDVEVAQVSEVTPRTNFVEAKELSAPVINIPSSADVNQTTGTQIASNNTPQKPKVSARQTGAGGKSKRPRINDIPNIIDDSGLVAINLGYM